MNFSLDLDQTLSVFGAYNSAIWPMQVFAYLAGLVALYSATKQTRFSNNIASGSSPSSGFGRVSSSVCSSGPLSIRVRTRSECCS